MDFRRPFCLSLLSLLLLMAPLSGLAEDTGVKVLEMAVTTRIVRGDPLDAVRRISSASAKALYCHTLVSVPDEAPREISHVWLLNGQVAANYTLPVRGPRWRTFSKKWILKGMEGLWRVEARDSEGRLLKSAEFRVN